jgi:hypothetical protein
MKITCVNTEARNSHEGGIMVPEYLMALKKKHNSNSENITHIITKHLFTFGSKTAPCNTTDSAA